jgi:hypothetical protein
MTGHAVAPIADDAATSTLVIARPQAVAIQCGA